MQIYIDYAGGEDSEFIENLKLNLKSLSSDISVVEYDDISIDEQAPDAWESVTLKAIDNSKIVIPLLTSGYFNFASKKIGKKFNDIIDSNDRYLLPIMMEDSDWSSSSWVVRSKLYPSNGGSIEKLSKSQQNGLVGTICRTIKDIMVQQESHSQRINSSYVKQSEYKSVFISHAHVDADFAELLKLKLEKSGIDAWIDNERLKVGQDWREEIDSGIEKSMAVIAVMTPDARQSEYVTYEWAFAWGKGKKIFPVMLKQTPLHPRLESLQYMDFTNRVSRPWDELISAIHQQAI